MAVPKIIFWRMATLSFLEIPKLDNSDHIYTNLLDIDSRQVLVSRHMDWLVTEIVNAREIENVSKGKTSMNKVK